MINQDFFLALEELERQKGISQDEFIAALENAMSIAYKKMQGASGDISIKLNPEKKSIFQKVWFLFFGSMEIDFAHKVM